MKQLKTDICIIGAGAGGLTVAAVAAQLGVSVTLLERRKMGGDCLNYGCVPSKSFLAAAKAAQSFRQAKLFGIKNVEPEVDFPQVMAQVKAVIDVIAEHDSVARFEKLGAKVILAEGKFAAPDRVIAGDYEISARRFVVATGSTAAIPPIPGLDKVPYLTNESVFDLQVKPQHLLIIGGGPIGCELAQAFAMLGVPVTVLEGRNALARDDQELVGILKQQLSANGIKLQENIKITAVKPNTDGQIQIDCEINGQGQTLTGSHVLVAAGRQPNIDALNLQAANIKQDKRGIIVDARLRSSNRKVYAIGDVVAGGYQFTHMAGYHAGIVIRNLLFGMPAKVNYHAVPWVTYTHPELAQVGLTEAQAKEQGKKIRVITANLAENDRAQTNHDTVGRIKVVADEKGYVLGVSILGAEAGELLAPWILAIQNKLKLSSLTGIILPYPTLSELNKLAAGNFYRDKLFAKTTQKLVKFILWFKR